MGTFLFILAIGLAWWSISRYVARWKRLSAFKKRQEAAKEKWGNRPRSGTLEERNEDIIRSHIERLEDRFHAESYLDRPVENCIQEIAEAEGRLSEVETYKYKWSSDFQSLAKSLKRRFRARIDELRLLERERKKREAEAEVKTDALQEKYSALIAAFYEVAERKVSLRDDYGDERWDALDKEIERVLCKIGTAEGRGDASQWKKDSGMPEEYQRLSTFLAQSFKDRHRRRQTERTQAVDCSSMSGVEFELYVIGLLSQLGFTDIRSTPATNDQGADLLAKKEGRTVIIQAKRYAGSVGNSAVQEVVGALHFYSGDEGWVVTNSTFTRSAKELAQRAGIRLIDGHELGRLSIKNSVGEI